MVKIEKWIRRKFHKSIFFLNQLRKSHSYHQKLKELVSRFQSWSKKRPWREENLIFGNESERGTSTPFSHYSSFDSLASSPQLKTEQQAKKYILASGDGLAEKSLESCNRKSGRTNLRSKSCFSKSLSLLDRAKREFDLGVEDESRLSNRRDVIMRDLINSAKSEGKDVL